MNVSENFGNSLVEKALYDAVMPDAWRWTRVDDNCPTRDHLSSFPPPTAVEVPVSGLTAERNQKMVRHALISLYHLSTNSSVVRSKFQGHPNPPGRKVPPSLPNQ